jgi:A/G-specific adenine glycosylase
MKMEQDISISQQDWKFFLDTLKKWYHPDKRKLPWKDIDNAYLVWVSEVFLQQTQADRVVEFFLRFTAKFPTVEHLARASFEEALPYFRGLGFYGRLRRMLETAREIVASSKLQDPSGKAQFPKEISELEKLPGVGPYTARAVASFAYKQKVLAPDTNVMRILWRFFGEGNKGLKGNNGNKEIMNHLDWFDEHYPKNFNLNQVLMDFGSHCSAAAPKCESCPLLQKCEFGKSPERLLQLVRKPKVSIPRHYKKVVVGILIQGKKVLVSRRRKDQSFSGLFEFPGGKVEMGEDERRALQREFLEEVGVEISVRPPFEKIVQHEKRQVLYFHRCRILTGKPQSMEGQEVMWMDQKKLDAKKFLPSNKGIIEQLKKSRL